MSLLRIPFSMSVIWAVHTCMTAPQPPPQPGERVGPIGLEVKIMPTMIKTFFWFLGLTEILVVLANIRPSSDVSVLVFKAAVQSSMPPDKIRVSVLSLFAWVCCLSGAFIRHSCYRTLGSMFTFEISLRKSHRLVTSGPYSFVRHPSYSSGALVLFGASACYTTPGAWALECSGIFGHPWTGPLMIICWLIPCFVFRVAIIPRLDREDGILRAHFGAQWDAWAKQVPFKLIPGIY